MVASTYDRALSLVLKHEGGWSDDPHDPGGATNLGVTIGTLSLYLGRSATKAEVRALTVAKVGPIYRRNYWDAIQGDDLPAGLDYALFDFAVNSGPKRAVIGLQRVLGVADDGKLGPRTLAAIASRDTKGLIGGLCSGRLGFLQSLSTWGRYGRGWQRRVDEVRATGLTMVVARPAMAVTHLPSPGNPLPPVPVNTGAPSTRPIAEAAGRAVDAALPPVRGELVTASGGFVSWLKRLTGGKAA